MKTKDIRQESHRIYFQRFILDGNRKEIKHNVESARIRLTATARCNDVTSLLRKKFDLPTLTNSQSPSSPSRTSASSSTNLLNDSDVPLAHRIHSRLEQIRAAVSESNDNLLNNSRNATASDQQSKCDTLVLVATIFSLPHDYLQFEHHETSAQFSSFTNTSANSPPSPTTSYPSEMKEVSSSKSETIMNSQNNESNTPSTSNHISEPFNIVCTLQPHDIPLEKKDEIMAQSVEKVMRHIPSAQQTFNIKPPLLRWFFVPIYLKGDNDSEVDLKQNNLGIYNANGRAPSLCTSSVDIDGYVTDMEYDSDIDDSIVAETFDNSDTFSWKSHQCSSYYYADEGVLLKCPLRQRIQKERYLQAIMLRLESETDCVSGHLLKKSRRDDNVWKRVYCVLTEGKFFYVSRKKDIHEYSTVATKDIVDCRVAKHKMIDLRGACINKCQPNEHHHIHTFEIRTKCGTLHIFRATKRTTQAQWIKRLLVYTKNCNDNYLFDNADAIITKEAVVRGKKSKITLMDEFSLLKKETIDETILD